jgi:hypothetical protein
MAAIPQIAYERGDIEITSELLLRRPAAMRDAAEWDESLHPRDESGKFSDSGGAASASASDRPEPASISDRVSAIEAEMERVDERSMGSTDIEADERGGREYAALDIMTTILRNQAKADANPALAAKSKFLYVMDDSRPGGIVAAAQAVMKDDRTVDLSWAASLKPGAGGRLMRDLIEWGKSRGATRAVGVSEHGSFPLAKRGGAVQTGEADPFSGGVPFEIDLTGKMRGAEEHGDTDTLPMLIGAEWDESQHPRDEGGKFTDGGGASAGRERPRSTKIDAGGAKLSRPLSKRESSILHDWVGKIESEEDSFAGGSGLNYFLRKDPTMMADMDRATSREFKARISELTAAIGRSVTTRDAVLMRGVSRDVAKSMTTGKSFTDRGFTALTTSKKYATGFSHDIDDTKGTVFLVHIPKGTPLLDVTKAAGLAKIEDEGEHLLAPGTRFEVIGPNELRVVRGKR